MSSTHDIQLTHFGCRITFLGVLDEAASRAWLADLRQLLQQAGRVPAVLVDMRSLRPLSMAAQAIIGVGQELCRQHGMQRSAVIVEGSELKIQFRRLAMRTGIAPGERYIDATLLGNWEQVALDWLLDGHEPGSRLSHHFD